VASGREILRVPTIRGVSDYPEGSPYGTAYIAENCERAKGYWRPRRGTALYNHPGTTLAGGFCKNILLADEFRGWNAAKKMIMVATRSDGYWDTSLASPGDVTTTDSQIFARARPGYRPSMAKFMNEALVFQPVADGGQPSGIIRVSAAGVLGIYRYNSSGAAASEDEGPFFDASTDWTEINKACFGVEHEARMFFGGYIGEEDKVRYSARENHQLVAKTNEFTIHERVTGLASFVGALIAFSEGAAYAVNFGGQGVDQPKILLSEIGCLAHQTIVRYGNRLAFLSRRGLVSMDQNGNLENLSYPIWEQLQQWTEDFANASCIYYPQKDQIWLLLPASGRIYVYNLDTKEWSWFKFDTSTNRIYPQCLGRTETDEGLVPIVGFTNTFNRASVSITQHGELYDALGYGQDKIEYKAIWLSHQNMILGHHQPRIFSDIRMILRDCGPENKIRIFWNTEGQQPGTNYLTGTQYHDSTLGGGSAARFSVTDKASITITDWTSIPAGTIVEFVVTYNGIDRYYSFTEGAPGSWNAAVSENMTAAVLWAVIVAAGIPGLTATVLGAVVTLDANGTLGYVMSHCAEYDPAAAFPGDAAGISAGLTTEADDSVFGTAVFTTDVGNLDFADVVRVSGVRRGRWFQWGWQQYEAGMDCGIRSAEIDTRRLEGRK
jgi:hypothetical protein